MAPTTFEKVELPEPKGFGEPVKLEAFLDAVRWGAASIADTRQLQSPFRSGIEIESYQLDPVVRAVQMPRVNLLIADDVGLGKTIESGLVISELIFRHRANRIVVVCPSPLQIKWGDEMLEKFGLEFVIVDSALVKRLRRERGLYANPWSHFPPPYHVDGLSQARVSLARSTAALARIFDQAEEEFPDETEQHEAEIEALEAAARAFRPASTSETQLVNELAAWAERASAQLDSKAAELIKWLDSVVRPEAQWNNERVIIFTEYRDTQKWLHDHLASRVSKSKGV